MTMEGPLFLYTVEKSLLQNNIKGANESLRVCNNKDRPRCFTLFQCLLFKVEIVAVDRLAAVFKLHRQVGVNGRRLLRC